MNTYKPIALEEHEMAFQSTVHRFAHDHLSGLVATRMDQTGEFPEELIQMMFENQFMGIEIPEQFGGSEGNFMLAVLAVEEISKVNCAAGAPVDVQNTLVNNAIMRWGSPELQAEFLPRLAKDTIGAYALTEERSGSAALEMGTTATQAGDDFIINGSKKFITSGARAGIYIVATMTGVNQFTTFVVDRKSPGLSVGRKEWKMGIRASDTVRLEFDNVKVPKRNILGELHQGTRVIFNTLNDGRIAIAMQAIALAERALEITIQQCRERRQFGQPIANFQDIHFALAGFAAEIEAARDFVLKAVRMREAELNVVQHAAMAKYLASEMAVRVVTKCLECWGGDGYMEEMEINRIFRDAQITKIYEGTRAMQLLTIAKMIGLIA